MIEASPSLWTLTAGLAGTGLGAALNARVFSASPDLARLRPRLIACAIGVLISALAWLAAIQLSEARGLAFAASLAGASAFGAALSDWLDGEVSDWHSAAIFVSALIAAPSLHPVLTWPLTLVGAILGFAVLWLAGWLYHRSRGERGIGQGDYGLAAAGGAWVGAGLVGPALLIAVAATALTAWIRRVGARERIAFAPGLVAGFAGALIIERVLR
ncbi:MAG: A24 family peptidase [Pseudomonadota bacterium]